MLTSISGRVFAGKLSPATIQERIDSLCKPPGSLGDLERLAFELCRIQNTLTPETKPRRVVIFAADHGVAARGVTAWPSEVTSAVVEVMATGRSASGVLARNNNAEYHVLDVGCLRHPRVNAIDDSSTQAKFISARVAAGTADLSIAAAMTRTQFHAAWRVGLAQADSAADDGCIVVAAGEMGIGNTTSASCLVTLLTGLSPEVSVGRGAGVDDRGLERKRNFVKSATNRVTPIAIKGDWKGVACEVGGFEIVAMSAFFTRSAQRGLTLILDGYIATAAALLAERLYPGTARSMIAAHQSAEPGHEVALKHLGLVPFLRWNMRLGEATGAIMLFPLLDSAAAVITQMATLADVTMPTTAYTDEQK